MAANPGGERPSRNMILAEQAAASCNIEFRCLRSRFPRPARECWSSIRSATCCADMPRRPWDRPDHSPRAFHRPPVDRDPAATHQGDPRVPPGGRPVRFFRLAGCDQPVEKSRIAGAALETTDIRDVVLVVDRAAEWREIALNPPAAMKFEWKAVAHLSAANRRLHRIPASFPQQNPARWHARR